MNQPVASPETSRATRLYEVSADGIVRRVDAEGRAAVVLWRGAMEDAALAILGDAFGHPELAVRHCHRLADALRGRRFGRSPARIEIGELAAWIRGGGPAVARASDVAGREAGPGRFERRGAEADSGAPLPGDGERRRGGDRREDDDLHLVVRPSVGGALSLRVGGTLDARAAAVTSELVDQLHDERRGPVELDLGAFDLGGALGAHLLKRLDALAAVRGMDLAVAGVPAEVAERLAGRLTRLRLVVRGRTDP